MTDSPLKTYMTRAGIRSLRELASLTGIKHATVDNIAKHPTTARGYQIREIAGACGMSAAEVVEVFTRG
jgi:DNA-binding MurR/RpiR family transcriptional regulator